MKRLSICSILLLLVFAAGAQAPETVNGFAVGGGIDATTGSEAIIGQPFTQFAQTADYNATLGIGQSQLVLTKVNAIVNEGEGYSANGFNYPSTTTAGTYRDTNYSQLGSLLNYDSMTVSGHGQEQKLPQKEFLLLYKLLSYPGKIFTRIQLMDEIWGNESETGWESVTVHIGRLRRRFEGWPEFEIQSVRGLGYKAVKKV